MGALSVKDQHQQQQLDEALQQDQAQDQVLRRQLSCISTLRARAPSLAP
jgi:hypothetical protein